MGCRDGWPERKLPEKQETPAECYLLFSKGYPQSINVHYDKTWALHLAAEFGGALIGPVPVVASYK